ncbi:MAG: S-adenosylmethionine/S-adenosylhomocysteine transporter [Chlamydiales bacterium]|nr:S-adenosylmethionine/S-adenosylhomocysteine transporter [Chlamydiales bacterium]MCH9619613.1 S-adenosylmethionine/S-adenosylhomocysteine transporter [Chlamydiales bacterium]MCH9623219.1 S-adenosylmethionine/S-adenosylhomocysteine transporter [Chlamydiales bacterium]
MNLFLVFFNFFIWASSFSLAKAAMRYSPPLYVTGIRMAIAGAILLLFLALFRRKDFRITKAQILPLTLLSLSAVYLTNAFEFWGLQYLTAAKACFIYSLSPFFAALFSYIQFKEKITKRKMLGLGVGFIGFSPVFLSSPGSESVMGSFFIFSWPEIALILATLTSVYGWILLRRLGKDEGMSPLMANGSSMLIGGLFALIHSLFVDSWTPTPVSDYVNFFKWIILIIFISNLFCYNLYGWLLKRYSATFLSFAGMTTPLFAAVWGWVMHAEGLPWTFFFSMCVVGVGLWLVYSEELRLGYISKKAVSV